MAKYKEINPKLDLVKIEKEILSNWEKKKIFEKVTKSTSHGEEWVYYDGPITANGMPHYGHAIPWILKDVIPRFKTMQGYSVSRNMGWDCQGILVEYEVEKALGFEEKGDIEKYGIDKFNQKCRESVLKFRDSMIEYETKLGRWLNDKQYSTMDAEYIESMWWSFKQLHEKGLLYEGHKVVAYSTRAGMTLSDHEVADGGYKEIVDPAVTLKFKLKDHKDTFVLAWTTTPWTLPGNLMLSVGKEIKYVKVKVNEVYFILAKAALERVFVDEKYELIEEINPSELEGLSYEPLFNYYTDRTEHGAFKIIYADHVNTEEGTGVVHLAPYGMEDFEIFRELRIPLFDYLDEEGKVTEEIEEFKGMFYKKANKYIMQNLEERGLLYKHEDYPHQMPMCYRTQTPLIYKPMKSWYLNVTKLKPRLLEEASKINFVPPNMKKRFVAWIDNAHDWSLSRQRYWGTPMPIWVNEEDSSDILIVGSFKELEKLSGRKLDKDFDPHKPFVDEIVIKNEKGTYRRVLDVIDVWYDSGSMPFAQHHYPFENNDDFERQFPADYIAEGTDQIRLWFYTMFLLGVALFDRAPFKNVAVNGMLGDDKGKKMSKSKGNYPPIEEVFSNYGADMLRYFLLKSGVFRGEPSKFSYPLLEETRKEFFTMLWNSYRYFVTYAGAYDFTPGDLEEGKLSILDKWILLRLEETTAEVTENLEKYEIMYASRKLAPFVEDLSTWYIRRSRDEISEGNNVSMQVLYKCLKQLSVVLAPFLPMLSEEVYLGVTNGSDKESVHLESYPKAYEFTSDDLQLLKDMQTVRNICSVGNALRKESNLPLRQPLSSLVVISKPLEDSLSQLVKEELNVKEVAYTSKKPKGKEYVNNEENGLSVYLNTTISEDLRLEGELRSLIRTVQSLRKEAGLNVEDSVKLTLEKTETNKSIVERFEESLLNKVGAESVTLGEETAVIKN